MLLEHHYLVGKLQLGPEREKGVIKLGADKNKRGKGATYTSKWEKRVVFKKTLGENCFSKNNGFEIVKLEDRKLFLR